MHVPTALALALALALIACAVAAVAVVVIRHRWRVAAPLALAAGRSAHRGRQRPRGGGRDDGDDGPGAKRARTGPQAARLSDDGPGAKRARTGPQAARLSDLTSVHGLLDLITTHLDGIDLHAFRRVARPYREASTRAIAQLRPELRYSNLSTEKPFESGERSVEFTCGAVSPDHAMFAFGDGGAIRISSLTGDERTTEFATTLVDYRMAFSSDATRLVCVNRRFVEVFQLATDARPSGPRSYPVNACGPVHAVYCTASHVVFQCRPMIGVPDPRDTLRIMDLETGRVDSYGGVRCACVRPATQTVIMDLYDSDTALRELDIHGAVVSEIAVAAQSGWSQVACSANGRKLAAFEMDHTNTVHIFLWDFLDQTRVKISVDADELEDRFELSVQPPVTAGALSPDGEMVFVALELEDEDAYVTDDYDPATHLMGLVLGYECSTGNLKVRSTFAGFRFRKLDVFIAMGKYKIIGEYKLGVATLDVPMQLEPAQQERRARLLG